MKNYQELVALITFEERLKYLTLSSSVGAATFGGHRYLNQKLYRSEEWKKTRRKVILRDGGFDLAHPDYPIGSTIYIHHINPITIGDLIDNNPKVFDMDNLISVSFETHQKIHYGDGTVNEWRERSKNDTCPWK